MNYADTIDDTTDTGCGCRLTPGPQPYLTVHRDGDTITVTHHPDSPWDHIDQLTATDPNNYPIGTATNLGRGASTTLNTSAATIHLTAFDDHPDHWNNPDVVWEFDTTPTHTVTPVPPGQLTSGLHNLTCTEYGTP